jgi:hypothetical protein
MSDRRQLRDLPTFCFAFVGLIVGHLLSYLIAIPDAARRDAVLAETGHAYLHVAGDIAVVLAFAAVVTVGLRAVAERNATEVPSGFRLAWRLGALQASAFVAMEVGERLVSGAGLGELFADHLFATGIVVQLVIAAIGTLLLRWLGRVAVRIAAVLARSRRLRPTRTTWVRPGSARPPRPAFAGNVSARAPPLP